MHQSQKNDFPTREMGPSKGQTGLKRFTVQILISDGPSLLSDSRGVQVVPGRHQLLLLPSQHRTWTVASSRGSTGYRHQEAGWSRSPPGVCELEDRLKNQKTGRNIRQPQQALCFLTFLNTRSLSRVEPQPVMVHFLKGGSGVLQMSMGLTNWLKTSGCCSFSRDMSFSLVRVL